MASFARQLTVNYSPVQMFNLVDDVDSYADFLSWCSKASVDKREGNEVEASLTLKRGPLSHSFSTINIHDREELMIAVKLKRGPLSSLLGKWTFTETEQGCLVSFEITYSFTSIILDKLLGPLFASVYEHMVGAFATRAEKIYGKK